MIACRPEFSRSIPRGSMLLIDTVLEKIVRAGLVRSMMETDGPLRRFFFGLMGTCHDERPRSFLRDRPSWEALSLKPFYLIQQRPTRSLLSSGQGERRKRDVIAGCSPPGLVPPHSRGFIRFIQRKRQKPAKPQ